MRLPEKAFFVFWFKMYVNVIMAYAIYMFYLIFLE